MAKYPPNPERSNKETKAAEEPMPAAPAVTTAELREHLKGLQGISAIASKLFVLLGEQITAASHTIPIQRGNDIVHHLTSLPDLSLTLHSFRTSGANTTSIKTD